MPAHNEAARRRKESKQKTAAERQHSAIRELSDLEQ